MSLRLLRQQLGKSLHHCKQPQQQLPRPQQPALLSPLPKPAPQWAPPRPPERAGGILAWYLRAIDSRPILTKSITAGSIFAAADLTSQMIIGASPDSFELLRTFRMAGYGLIVLGPTLHLWFCTVSKMLPKRDMISTLKKICIGQTMFGPLMTAVFFSTNAALQGENGYEIVARLKRDLLPTMKSGLLFWPLADFVTFKFIPIHLQPVVCNSFSFFWTVYLTKTASSQKVSSDAVTEVQASDRQSKSSFWMLEGNFRKEERWQILHLKTED